MGNEGLTQLVWVVHALYFPKKGQVLVLLLGSNL